MHSTDLSIKNVQQMRVQHTTFRNITVTETYPHKPK